MGTSQVIFAFVLLLAVGFFCRNMGQLWRNIHLGKPFLHESSERMARLGRLLRLALAQGKMGVRPVAGLLHLVVYVGFLVVNIEMLEIITDGLMGTHRAFAFMGNFYNWLIGSFEIMALAVMISVVVFWLRRNVLKINRFEKPEIQKWAKTDANNILYFEAMLMLLFLLMNAADFSLQQQGIYPQAGSFPVSQFIAPMLPTASNTLIIVERMSWWLHIAGVLVFMNYLYYSKHLHIFLAFPYTYFSSLSPKGKMQNMPQITQEIRLMLDPTLALPTESEPEKLSFGANDVFDLENVQLLAAYACTQCGRCSDECPANLTGKKLSPRKIMMNTRERIQEVGQNIRSNGQFSSDGKTLLHQYISSEEIWACTSCGACVEACPLEISPMSIILEMRRFLVMEQTAAPQSIHLMHSNIENNGAPWAYSPDVRNKIFS